MELAVPNHSLRIVIADDQYFQCLSIEKMLNQLGYYCIVPVRSLEEVVILTENAINYFDLLIISSALASTVEIDIDVFSRNNPHIHHVLIYDGQGPQLLPGSLAPAVGIQVSLTRVPDSESLRQFMGVIYLQPRNLYQPMVVD